MYLHNPKSETKTNAGKELGRSSAAAEESSRRGGAAAAAAVGLAGETGAVRSARPRNQSNRAEGIGLRSSQTAVSARAVYSGPCRALSLLRDSGRS